MHRNEVHMQVEMIKNLVDEAKQTQSLAKKLQIRKQVREIVRGLGITVEQSPKR